MGCEVAEEPIRSPVADPFIVFGLGSEKSGRGCEEQVASVAVRDEVDQVASVGAEPCGGVVSFPQGRDPVLLFGFCREEMALLRMFK